MDADAPIKAELLTRLCAAICGKSVSEAPVWKLEDAEEILADYKIERKQDAHVDA